MTTEYSIETARQALPYLVYAAQKRQVFTYGGLAQIMGYHHRAIPPALYYTKEDICKARNLPPLTAIVVNQATGLPGDGFLPDGTGPLSDAAYQREYEAFRDRVFAYQRWNDLLYELGLQPIASTDDELDAEGRAYAEYLKRQDVSVEGEAHRALKAYIAAHPGVLGLVPVKPGEQEHLFPSGDECDVTFDLGGSYAVVEVKNGAHAELVKGVYQAVKYRALMEAEKGHGQAVQVGAFLVAYSIPDDIVAFADRLKVSCQVVAELK